MEVTRAAIIDDEPARRRPQDADDRDPDDRDPGDGPAGAARCMAAPLPGAPAPADSAVDLLMRGIAYKLQEQVHGGLSKAARRRLRALAQAFAETGRVAPGNGTKVRPGTRLVREWRGRTQVVTATESGFDYDGGGLWFLDRYRPTHHGRALVRSPLLRCFFREVLLRAEDFRPKAA